MADAGELIARQGGGGQPGAGGFERGGGSEHGTIGVASADDLESDRQALGVKPQGTVRPAGR